MNTVVVTVNKSLRNREWLCKTREGNAKE